MIPQEPTSFAAGSPMLPRIVFWPLALLCLSSWSSPGLALAIGLAMALIMGNAFQAHTKSVAKYLLQASVIALGFGTNLHVLLASAKQGFSFSLVTIVTTMVLGVVLGRWLRIEHRLSALLCAGTAICGGSAIAVVSLSIGAAEGEISVAMGTVFLLNAAALYLFPLLGHALSLSQTQFGIWAGTAIHDVSSVVAAATGFGPEALQVATAVKLSRTLWIVPVAVVAGSFTRKSSQAGTRSVASTVPWFAGLFLLASLIRSTGAIPEPAAAVISHAARAGMTLTLFLIGASLSISTLKSVGWRPILHGLLLWLFVSVTALILVMRSHFV